MMVVDDRARALSQYKEYLEAYSLGSVVRDSELLRKFAGIYKNYHALLVWQSYINSKPLSHFKNTTEFQEFKLYFDESVSDICLGIFLSVQGIYKPSLLTVRSAVENFIKSIGLYERQNVLTLTSVYELIELVKGLPIVNKTAATKKSYAELRALYKDLCSYVHTQDVNHMSLTSAVGNFPRFDSALFHHCDKAIISAIKITCTYCCYMFTSDFRKMHHNSHDFICDILPKNVKQEITT